MCILNNQFIEGSGGIWFFRFGPSLPVIAIAADQKLNHGNPSPT
jgi:hypothetical protein